MKNTLKYSQHMQKNPVHPDEPEKAYARLQLNGVLDINARWAKNPQPLGEGEGVQ